MFWLFLFLSRSEEFNFTATKNGVEISRKENQTYKGVLKIPSTTKINSKSVQITSIGSFAFSESSISEVHIQGSVTEIKESAFQKCLFLQTVNLKDTKITTIGMNAFRECISLESILFPQTIEKIGDFSFFDCEKIKALDISNTAIYEIGESGFSGCSALNDIKLSKALKIIGKEAFKETSFTSFAFPDILEKIGEGAFAKTQLSNVDISDTFVTILEANTFEKCTKLATVSLPPSLRKIGDSCFAGDSLLTSIDTSFTCVEYIGDYSFSNCSKLSTILFSPALLYLGSYSLEGTCATMFTAPSTIKKFGKYIMKGNTYLVSASFYSITGDIPEGIFAGCEKLSDIKWPIRSFNILGHAFENTAITSLEFPDYIGDIHDYAFAHCHKLASIKLSNINHSFTGTHIFFDCNNMNSISYPTAAKISLPPYFLAGTAITYYNITRNIVKIGAGCFSHCSHMKSASLLNSTLDVLDHEVFNGNNMSYVFLPASIKTIGVDSLSDNTIQLVIFFGKHYPNIGYMGNIGCVRVPFDYAGDYFCGTKVTRVCYKDLLMMKFDDKPSFIYVIAFFVSAVILTFVALKGYECLEEAKKVKEFDEEKLLA